MRAHDVRRVLQPVWSHPTNLISIFGRARQGKSFLMNCLAGETEIFRISNEKESCTQGIDVSNKFMSVRHFATIDGGRLDARGHEVDNIRVGFVDAEGQGDKDVSYDANLICPILLASKCVIFNWKGDMQKDAILNTLGIMCRAAQNVGVESGSSHKFGHLHIVFRDWQAEGSTAEDTFQHLFRQETSSEASTRNKIRRDLQEAFTSIRVWLLDAPTELVSDLKKKLTIEKTSALFRSQIRELRAALSHELTSPGRFGESVLTGKVLYSAMSVMADTLNQGQVVLPGAAYRAMLAEELRANRDHFQRDVQLKVEELIGTIRTRSKVAHAASDDDAGDIMSGEEAAWLFDEEVGAIARKYEELVAGILETTPGDHTYDGLRTQEKTAMATFQQQASDHFFAQWTNEVNKWVLPSRQAAEQRLERLIRDVLQKMPALVHDGEQTSKRSGLTSEMLLTAVIQEVWVKVSACFGTKQPCFQDNPIFVDAVQTLQRHFDTAQATLWSKFEECYAVIIRANIESLAQEAGDEMTRQIDVLPTQLYAVHVLGFPIELYMMALNQEFHRLKAQIEDKVRHSLLPAASSSSASSASSTSSNVSEKIVETTTADVIQALETQIAASLKGHAIRAYKEFREGIFAAVMKKAGEDFLPMLHRLAEGWESREPDLDHIDPNQAYYGPTLTDVINDIQHVKTVCKRDILSGLCGWFCENVQEYDILASSKSPSLLVGPIHFQSTVQQQKVHQILLDFERHVQQEVNATVQTSSLALKFLIQLNEYLASIIAPFQQEARAIVLAMEEEYEVKVGAVLEEREAAAAAAAAAAARAEEEERAAAEAAAAAAAAAAAYADEAMDECDYEDDYPVATKTSSTATGTKGTTSAVAEQRRRAAEWAAKNLKMTAAKRAATAASGAGATDTKRKSAASRFGQMKPTKTVEQQRRDALEFARRVFGDAVLREEDSDNDDRDAEVVEAATAAGRSRRGPSSSSSLSAAPAPAIAVTSARGKSAIEAAKEAARQLQEQRLRNQATDAAGRAKEVAEKKKRSKA